MERDFFCDLTPTLQSPNNKPKEKVSFYCQWQKKEMSYKLYGVSASGVLKEGELKLSEEDDSSWVGGFLELDVEIKVSFKPSFFDIPFIIGGGEWKEFTADDVLRQSYKANIWDADLSEVGVDFVKGVSDRFAVIQQQIEDVDEKREELAEKVSDLTDKVEEASDEADNFVNSKSDLDSTLDAVEAAKDELKESLKSWREEHKFFLKERDSLSEQNIQADLLSQRLDRIREAAEETQSQAEKTLSSSITVQLARSFKQRKEDSEKSRVNYDKWFVGAIAVAITISLIFVGFATAFGTAGSSYFEYMISRVPVLIFPIWLAVFFAKKSSAASRLEEFYAQKQALAESYEGYKSEITKIPGEGGQEELLALMTINLVSIGKDSAGVWDEALKEKHSPLESVVGDKLDILIGKMRRRKTDSLSPEDADS